MSRGVMRVQPALNYNVTFFGITNGSTSAWGGLSYNSVSLFEASASLAT